MFEKIQINKTVTTARTFLVLNRSAIDERRKAGMMTKAIYSELRETLKNKGHPVSFHYSTLCRFINEFAPRNKPSLPSKPLPIPQATKRDREPAKLPENPTQKPFISNQKIDEDDLI